MSRSVYLVVEDHYERPILSAHLSFESAQRAKRESEAKGFSVLIESYPVTE